MRRHFTPSILILAVLFAVAIPMAAQTDDDTMVATTAGTETEAVTFGRISITNIGNQPLAPVAVATHASGVTPIFIPGAAASSELATLAETGNPAALQALLQINPYVHHATHFAGMATVILPGETVSGDIRFNAENRAVSIASMLVSTNDGFAAYTGAEIPLEGSRSYWAYAWDAGSEANTEACTDLPGPPCTEESNARVTEGAEGRVLIHPGIHGQGDVTPNYDWRGPVAIITLSPDGGEDSIVIQRP